MASMTANESPKKEKMNQKEVNMRMGSEINANELENPNPITPGERTHKKNKTDFLTKK